MEELCLAYLANTCWILGFCTCGHQWTSDATYEMMKIIKNTIEEIKLSNKMQSIAIILLSAIEDPIKLRLFIDELIEVGGIF